MNLKDSIELVMYRYRNGYYKDNAETKASQEVLNIFLEFIKKEGAQNIDGVNRL